MGKKNRSNSAIGLIKKVIKIEEVMPSEEKMIQEIKMMDFKIRSLAGDLFLTAKNNIEFLGVLWRVGKITEVINSEIEYLDKKQREIFFDYLETLQNQIAQKSFPASETHWARDDEVMNLLKLEIFKEKKYKNTN